MRDDLVQMAIRMAAMRYSAQEWLMLPADQKVRAIYDELRRLDARIQPGSEAPTADARPADARSRKD